MMVLVTLKDAPAVYRKIPPASSDVFLSHVNLT